MPSTGNQGSFSPFRSFGRSILGMRRKPNPSLAPNHNVSIEGDLELESFQRKVEERFNDLCAVEDDDLLSIVWVKKLLGVFISCQEDFRVVVLKKKDQITKPPLDRMVFECFETSLKALDICNATRDGIEKVRLWKKHLDIVVCALDSRERASLSEGQFRRARKALVDLTLAMLDEQESGSVFSHRNRSFGRHNITKDRPRHHRPSGHSRSLSWSVSESWSAAKQLQSIANNLLPPRANDIATTNGFAVPVYMMSCVLMFVLWTLVAAIPCQDRGLNIHFYIPKQFTWGVPLLSLHDKIMEESKKRERRNAGGLLKEVCRIEKCARYLTDLVDTAQLPLTEEQTIELEQEMNNLDLACHAIKNELDSLEHQVREVFQKIMSSRTEGLEILNKSKN